MESAQSSTSVPMASCPLCWAPTPEPALRQVERVEFGVLVRLAERDPFWRHQDGACPECVERAQLQLKKAHDDRAMKD